MGSKLVKQFGADILCYRLRTARQKKRMQYEDFDKWLMQLNREENRLFWEKRSLGWKPLIPPVQKGWKRFFVLRDDVARGKQAKFFEEILRKINKVEWSHRKDFKVKKRRVGRKTYIVRRQKLQEPDPGYFLKLNFSDDEKKFFQLECKYVRWGRVLKPHYYYAFREPWRFVLRVRPNMIDEERIKDPELESRLDRIRNFLDRNHLRPRQEHIKGRRYKSWRVKGEEKDKEVHPFKNRPLHRILDDLKEEL